MVFNIYNLHFPKNSFIPESFNNSHILYKLVDYKTTFAEICETTHKISPTQHTFLTFGKRLFDFGTNSMSKKYVQKSTIL